MAIEVWVVKSEHHLKEGALAYWGPFASRVEAEDEFDNDEGVVVIEIPSRGPEDES